MPHFYFMVQDGDGIASDDEGVDLPSLQAAIARAAEGARSIMSDDVRRGRLDLTGMIEIQDEAGGVAATVTYREALKIKL